MKITNHMLKEKSIVLTGFMGVGKSSVGKVLANQLLRDFVDTDHLIEKEFNMPITKIFEKYGEEVFRSKEKELIQNLVKKKLKVISVGGGAFLNEEIREACLKNGLVIYLDISWKKWLERLPSLIQSRPLLKDKMENEIKELFEVRRKLYSSHHTRILVDNHSILEVADTITKSIKLLHELY